MNLITFCIAIFSIFLNALAQICLRKTMLGTGPTPTSITDAPNYLFALAFNPWLIAGMSCYAISICAWLTVLSKVEVSVAYPLLSIGFIMATVMGYLFLGESINSTRIAGIALICIGIVCISRST